MTRPEAQDFEFQQLYSVSETIKTLSNYEQIFNALKKKYDEMEKDNRRLTSELIDTKRVNTELMFQLNNNHGKTLHTNADGLRKYLLDSNDFNLLLRLIGSKVITNQLCYYLHFNDLKVEIDEIFDPQTGWKGFRFIINGVDLSENGFCFTKEKLEEYLALH